jgi:hypothetical protein
MKDIFDNDDEVLGLVRKKGLLKPSADFTSRVMRTIEEIREPVAAFKPLLSTKAWIVLISAFMIMILICWQVMADSPSGTLPGYTGIMSRIADYFRGIDFSFKFDANALLIITLAIISMGLLLSIDLWFSNNRKERNVI